MNQHSEAGVQTAPDFPQLFGHPRPLWMLFMTEFWERFAFYSVSWALALYIVAQFYHGNAAGQGWASAIFSAYTALVYASSIFGGYVADKVIGYQRSILVGALVMGLGLFVMMLPEKNLLLCGLALVIVGNGLFKPNISSMVGQLYGIGDERRDRGFTLFYMGINFGALVAPLLTGWLAGYLTNTPMQQNYKVVFAAAGVGMILSMVWFWFGRRGLRGVGRPASGAEGLGRVAWVFVGIVIAVPLVYLLLRYGAERLSLVLAPLFVIVAALLIVEAMRHDKVQLDRVFAMLIIFAFNVLFWVFYYQLGTSFNFLAENLVDRRMPGGWIFPVAWFQSVSPLAIIVLAPVVSLTWGLLNKRHMEPSIPRKFGLGLIFNGLGFAGLMYALSRLIGEGGSLIPFWPLTLCYVLQTVGELCLSPIGLSMVTKLAPPRLVGVAMGGWFLSLAVGGNLSGLVAGYISGTHGMTAASALGGFTFGFWLLVAAGVLLLLISPLINRLMHGVK
ncbi:MFS transporter [Dyella monticola]|uniref:MFS transporter n=1 Tax=Dyella monticola TaxID=1927958 RepID=A0A370X3F6_9GAMM|nr:oligopeptide:H+ symporter [Dyella monticola]RDS82866.1 MFS transporter [Dyella monticola]